MPTEIFKSIVWDRRRVTKPGLYSRLPLTAYHKGDICDGPSVSSSGLRRLFSESPAHYWDTSPLNPRRGEDPETRAMIVGRAMHHLALGERNFGLVFTIEPDKYQNDKGEQKPWNNNARHCQWWHRRAKVEGRLPLTQKEADAIRGMAWALQHDDYVTKHGILGGYIERSAFMKDEETGLWLKVRPDVIPNHSGEYADLKTIKSVQDMDIYGAIERHGYNMQAALVRMVMTGLGFPFTGMSLVFVEKTRPHCVRVVDLKDKSLDLGEEQTREALHMLVTCLKRNEWPGPGAGNVDQVGLSDAADKRIGARIKFLRQQRELMSV